MLTAERIREVLSYDPETGVFTWRISPSTRVKVGDVAGHIDIKGYRRISIGRKVYKAHRLAFLWMTGEWPKTKEVDHADDNHDNNRWHNLREATNSQNQANTRLRTSNKSGFKGVSFSQPAKKWLAVIYHQGSRYQLGFFDNPEDASAAYQSAAQRLFGEFHRAA